MVCGPTAVGKTSLAIALAKEFNAPIFSSDSRQFYHEMSIGTAKPKQDELMEATHHFIGHKSIHEPYDVSDFEAELIPQLDKYFEEKNLAILCGGSGLYIDAICIGLDKGLPSKDHHLRKELNEILETKGLKAIQEVLNDLDPEALETIDAQNHKRIMRAIELVKLSGKPLSENRTGKGKSRSFNCLFIGLEMPRPQLYERINQRVDKMMEEGLESEAKSLLSFEGQNALKTVGYKELFNYFKGEWSLDFAIEKIKVNSRRYAKRQLTWFKKNEAIHWFKPTESLEVIAYIRKSIEKDGEPN